MKGHEKKEYYDKNVAKRKLLNSINKFDDETE